MNAPETRAGRTWRGSGLVSRFAVRGNRRQVSQRMMERWGKDGKQLEFLRDLEILNMEVSLGHC